MKQNFVMLRRSQRLQSKYCEYHENQVNYSEDSAFCGMISFNNALHKRCLEPEFCVKVAMKWVNARSENDPALRKVGDDKGRGAFSIGVLKVALEKKGFMIRSLGKFLGLETLTAHLVYDNSPCVVIVKSALSKDATEEFFTHAISICSKGFLHDPDFEVPYRLLGAECFQSWLEMDDLQIVQAYIIKDARRRKKKSFSSNMENVPSKKSRSE
jgi:hypothetical protein